MRMLQEKLSHNHYLKIVMQVEISLHDCLRNIIVALTDKIKVHVGYTVIIW